MSWTVLKPVAASAGRPMVSAQVRVTSKGKASIVLFLAGMQHDDLGAPEAAEVAVGEGEHSGCIRLTSGDVFPFKAGPGGSKRLQLPIIPGVSERPTAALACELIPEGPKGGGALVVRLPLAGWEAAIARPASREAFTAKAQPAPLRGEDGKVDALAYLKTKGHTVQILANSRLQIDGELHTPPQVLAKVNVHRRKAELAELTLADLKIG